MIFALKVTSDYQDEIVDNKIGVESIQDSVERVLVQAGYADIAKAYILYRKQRKVRNAKSTFLDYKELVDSYVNIEDLARKGKLHRYLFGWWTYPQQLWSDYCKLLAVRGIRRGDRKCSQKRRFAYTRLSMLTGYCAGWSLKQLIQEGLGGIEGKITSSPASHLSTLCNQMVNFLGIMQNEWAGAQAFSSFDTYLAPFAKAYILEYREIKQCIQSFIYGVYTPSRWGTQATFTNITLDWTVPETSLTSLQSWAARRWTSHTVTAKEMDMINKAFIDIMIEGDANGRGFQYPIPTYSITRDFDWSDTENNRMLFEMTAKYGTPYFSNYINSDMEPSDIRSMCCRLRLDLRELRKRAALLRQRREYRVYRSCHHQHATYSISG